MKTFSFTAAALLSLLAPVAMADFDIYLTKGRHNTRTIQIFEKEVTTDDCRDIDFTLELSIRPSAEYEGARCDGKKSDSCTLDGNPEDIDQLELNFSPKSLFRRKKGTHVTLYKDRNWGLYDYKNNKVGECVPAEGYSRHSVKCADPQHSELDVDTMKLFFCKSGSIDADNIWDTE